MQGLPSNNSELSQALNAIYTLIEGLRNDNTQLKLTTSGLHSKVSTVEEQNAKMSKIVVEGNGQRPLTTRMVVLEDAVNSIHSDNKEHITILRNDIIEIKNKINDLEDKDGHKAKQTVAFGLDITKTLIPIVITAIISLAITGFVTSFTDKKSEERNLIQQHEIDASKKIIEQNRQLIEALEKQEKSK